MEVVSELMSLSNLKDYFFQTSKKSLEEKQDSELTLEDRLHYLCLNNDDPRIIEELINLKKITNKIEINARVFEDLEFFNNFKNDTSHNTIYSKLNNTKTIMGNLHLKNIITNPINNINELTIRQNVLKDYNNISSKDLLEINTALEEIKKVENDIKWFWDENIQKHLYVLYDIVYLNLTGFEKIDNYLNKNTTLLFIFNMYRIFISPIVNMLSPLSTILIPLVLFLCFKKFLPIKISNKDFIKFIFNNVFNSNMMGMFFGKASFKNKLIGIVSTVVWVFFYLQNIYMSVKLSKNINRIINLIHSKLNSIKILLDNVGLLMRKCENIEINKIYNINIDSLQKTYIDFKKIFLNDLFTKKPYLLSNKGIILSTFKLFNNTKDFIKILLNYVGVIDYLNSNNLLLNKYNNDNIYTFSEYSNNEKPILNINKIWNPYIDENPVLNDVKIDKNIILTGPNAAGKSTFIKSVAINIILAQTIGIASCKTFKLTPFKILDTYLQIPDIKGNSSLFEAEMMRSKEYINKIKENEKLSFIIMDEIFSSTNYIEGFSGAYAILDKISKYDKSLFITTTHYNKLTTLPNTSKKITNYKFDIVKDASDNITFNYILKKGICNQYIALDLLKQNNFDEDIIQKAIEISNTLRKNKKPKKNIKTKKTDKHDKVDTIDKHDKVDTIDKHDKVDTIDKHDKVDTIDKHDKVDTIDKHDKVDTIDKHDKVDTIDKHDKVDTIDKHDKVDTIDTVDSTN